MFGFEGHYKKRKEISLGGAKQTLTKQQLLQRNQEERQKREQDRQRNNQAIKIQAFVRGKLEQKRVCQNTRNVWSSTENITTAIPKLLFFYNKEKDKARLEEICFELNKKGLQFLFELQPNELNRWNQMLLRLIHCILVTIPLQPKQYLNQTQLFIKNLLDTYHSSNHSQHQIKKVKFINQLLTFTFYQLFADYYTQLDSTNTFQFDWIFSVLLQSLEISKEMYIDTSIEFFTKCFITIPDKFQTISNYSDIHLPFKDILTICKESTDLATKDHTIQLTMLCNIIDIESRSQPLSVDTLCLYVTCLDTLLSRIPYSFTNEPSQYEDDEESMQVDSTQFTNTIETSTKTTLLTSTQQRCISHLTSSEHLLTILKLSENAELLPIMSSHLVGIISRWPRKKLDISTVILFQFDRNFIKQLFLTFNKSKLRTMIETKPLSLLFQDEVYATDWSMVSLFCELYSRLLITMADEEFFSTTTTISLSDTITLSMTLKKISFQLYWNTEIQNLDIKGSLLSVRYCRELFSSTLVHIHSRDSRRSFCPSDHWLVSNDDLVQTLAQIPALTEDFDGDYDEDDSSHVRSGLFKNEKLEAAQKILKHIPFVIPFEERVKLFRNFIRLDQGRYAGDIWMPATAHFEIRRDHVFEDGYNGLNSLGRKLKERIAITFIDQHGMQEAGIDGGGIFKEFLTSCLKEAFNTDLGLFSATEEQLLYPSATEYASGVLQLKMFEFLGRIIGKALYEDVLIDTAFAPFFLAKWLGRQNYLDDLPSLDQELYNGLLFLKNYKGNLNDLSLTMTTTKRTSEGTKVVDLVPNGSMVNVTEENRIKYIYLMANYKLNFQIARQCSYFFKGLSDLIKPTWIKMFNQQELQILIGGQAVPIDIQNLKANTQYGGVYDQDHPTIILFWKVLSEFTPEQSSKLVKFVTSCSRPPLLGFQQLNPNICIRFAGQDQERLPTASTCVNLLKLPAYQEENLLREKLLYAINAEAGFEFS